MAVFSTRKNCSSFWNYVSSRSLDIALKASFSERRRVVLLMESVQISPCGFICELSSRSQIKPQGEIWTLSINRTTLLLSLKDAFKAISRLLELT